MNYGFYLTQCICTGYCESWTLSLSLLLYYKFLVTSVKFFYNWLSLTLVDIVMQNMCHVLV